MEVHAVGPVERAVEDQQHPAQPRDQDAVAAHRHAGAGDIATLPRVRADVGDESCEQRRARRRRRRPARSSVNGSSAARSASTSSGSQWSRELVGVGAVVQQLAGQSAPSTATSPPGRIGQVRVRPAPRVSVRRGSSTHMVPPAGPEAAEIGDRIGERGAVAVGHDRVVADEHRGGRGCRGSTPGSSACARSRSSAATIDRRVVDRDRRVEGAAADRTEPPAR